MENSEDFLEIRRNLEKFICPSEEILENLGREKNLMQQRVNKLYDRRNILLNRLFKYQRIKNERPFRLFLSNSKKFGNSLKRVKNICEKNSERISETYNEILYNEIVISNLEYYFSK